LHCTYGSIRVRGSMPDLSWFIISENQNEFFSVNRSGLVKNFKNYLYLILYTVYRYIHLYSGSIMCLASVFYCVYCLHVLWLLVHCLSNWKYDSQNCLKKFSSVILFKIFFPFSYTFIIRCTRRSERSFNKSVLHTCWIFRSIHLLNPFAKCPGGALIHVNVFQCGEGTSCLKETRFHHYRARILNF